MGAGPAFSREADFLTQLGARRDKFCHCIFTAILTIDSGVARERGDTPFIFHGVIRMAGRKEKRDHRRVNAPVYFSYSPLLSRPATPVDISPGGLRMCSDVKMAVGRHIDLTITLSDGRIIECQGQVVWVKRLPGGGRARYDIGLGFLKLTKRNEKVLREYLAGY
jgi:hypothetical protein